MSMESVPPSKPTKRPPPSEGARGKIHKNDSNTRKLLERYRLLRKEPKFEVPGAKATAEVAAVEELVPTSLDLLKNKLNSISEDLTKRKELRSAIAEAEALFDEVRSTYSSEAIITYQRKHKIDINERLEVARHLADVYDQIALVGDDRRLETHLEVGGYGNIVDPHPGDAQMEASLRRKNELEHNKKHREALIKLRGLELGRTDAEAEETRGLEADDLTHRLVDRLKFLEDKIIQRFRNIKGHEPTREELDQLIYGTKHAVGPSPLSRTERAGQWFKRIGEATLGKVFDRFADTSLAQAIADYKTLEDEGTKVRETFEALDIEKKEREERRKRIQAQAAKIDPNVEAKKLADLKTRLAVKPPTLAEVQTQGRVLSKRDTELERKRRILARQQMEESDREIAAAPKETAVREDSEHALAETYAQEEIGRLVSRRMQEWRKQQRMAFMGLEDGALDPDSEEGKTEEDQTRDAMIAELQRARGGAKQNYTAVAEDMFFGKQDALVERKEKGALDVTDAARKRIIKAETPLPARPEPPQAIAPLEVRSQGKIESDTVTTKPPEPPGSDAPKKKVQPEDRDGLIALDAKPAQSVEPPPPSVEIIEESVPQKDPLVATKLPDIQDHDGPTLEEGEPVELDENFDVVPSQAPKTPLIKSPPPKETPTVSEKPPLDVVLKLADDLSMVNRKTIGDAGYFQGVHRTVENLNLDKKAFAALIKKLETALQKMNAALKKHKSDKKSPEQLRVYALKRIIDFLKKAPEERERIVRLHKDAETPVVGRAPIDPGAELPDLVAFDEEEGGKNRPILRFADEAPIAPSNNGRRRSPINPKRGELSLTGERERLHKIERSVESKLIADLNGLFKNLQKKDIDSGASEAELYLHTLEALRKAQSLQKIYELREEWGENRDAESRDNLDALDDELRSVLAITTQAQKADILRLERLSAKDSTMMDRLKLARRLPDILEKLVLENPSVQDLIVKKAVQTEYKALAEEFEELDRHIKSPIEPGNLEEASEARSRINRHYDLQLTMGSIEGLANETGIDLGSSRQSSTPQVETSSNIAAA